MEKFDIEKISKKMPYKPLDERYFEQLPLKTLAKIESMDSMEHKIATKKSRWEILRPFAAASVVAVAAAVMVGIFILPKEQSNRTDKEIDKFIATLSDSDLELIINEAEANDEFYTNL